MSVRAEAAPRGRITPRAVVLVMILLVLGISAFAPVRSFLAQRDEIDRLEQEVNELQSERVRLERELERIKDPDYVEQIARQCLGMVRPGEIAFTNPSGPKANAC
jgi:cell division protein FtsB